MKPCCAALPFAVVPTTCEHCSIPFLRLQFPSLSPTVTRKPRPRAPSTGPTFSAAVPHRHLIPRPTHPHVTSKGNLGTWDFASRVSALAPPVESSSRKSAELRKQARPLSAWARSRPTARLLRLLHNCPASPCRALRSFPPAAIPTWAQLPFDALERLGPVFKYFKPGDDTGQLSILPSAPLTTPLDVDDNIRVSPPHPNRLLTSWLVPRVRHHSLPARRPPRPLLPPPPLSPSPRMDPKKW